MSFHDCFGGQTLLGASVFSQPYVASAIARLEDALGSSFVAAAHVGSSYILGYGADLDIVVQVQCQMDHAHACLSLKDYVRSQTGSGDPDDDLFQCFRFGDVNVMLTTDEEWYDLFVKSAEVCKALRLTEKWQRIAVHRVLMDDEDADVAVRRAKEPA